MKASETKFQPIIEGTKQYVVPLFQRPYSWDKKEWGVLWEDLTWLCENNEPKSHFIGSIVTIPTVSVPEGVSKYLLIDGQQRLTTIFILLALLRDLSKPNSDSKLSQEIEQTMLVNPFKQEPDYFKLLPTQTQGDRETFKKLIRAEEMSEQSKIFQCYKFFERKLKQGTINVFDLNKVITTRLSVVSIVLDYDDNPHLVFESLNAKGHPLTQADLIRNYFFMRIHIDEQETTHAKFWEPMQVALGENLTEYVRHYLMRKGTIVKQGDVYFTLKDRIGQGDALNALKELATFAGYYDKLLSPEKESNETLKNSLKRLNLLEVRTAYPFLLNCYHDYTQGTISADDFSEILYVVENFVIRRFVCGIATNQLNKIFPSLYSQAHNSSNNLAEGVRQILQLRRYPKDTEFKTRLVDTNLYTAGEHIKTKLVLETLESAYQHKEKITFDNLTIEHVMPQTITPWWQEHLGEEWQADHELYLNTLGNLTLTAYNSELSNAPFPTKKEHLLKSHLELNKYFQSVSSWKRAEIEDRSKKLADLALKVWAYFGEEKAAIVNEDNITGKTPISVTILGNKKDVTCWRDVEQYTLNMIAELEPELFVQLVSEYPRFVSPEPVKFRQQRRLENGYFIELNLSAKNIYHFCSRAIETIGWSRDDWHVEAE